MKRTIARLSASVMAVTVGAVGLTLWAGRPAYADTVALAAAPPHERVALAGFTPTAIGMLIAAASTSASSTSWPSPSTIDAVIPHSGWPSARPRQHHTGKPSTAPTATPTPRTSHSPAPLRSPLAKSGPAGSSHVDQSPVQEVFGSVQPLPPAATNVDEQAGVGTAWWWSGAGFLLFMLLTALAVLWRYRRLAAPPPQPVLITARRLRPPAGATRESRSADPRPTGSYMALGTTYITYRRRRVARDGRLRAANPFLRGRRHA